jgi:hypothetical protein
MSKHEESVKAKIDARCAAGFGKYKKTMERIDLTRLQWLQHAQDEAMDLAIYLQRLIDDESSERREVAEVIPWAKYPNARFAAKDADGRVAVYALGPPPYIGPQLKWVCRTTWEYVEATIPGPWQDSLRARPEGV